MIEIETELSEEQQRAIQLSHNALTGKDDPNILREIYESLSLDWKKYSAVYEEMFKLDEEKAIALGVPIAKYEELVIAFLPEDREAFFAFATMLETRYKKAYALIGERSDFDAFFDAVLAVKDARKIGNTGTALRVMAEIVAEALAKTARTRRNRPTFGSDKRTKSATKARQKKAARKACPLIRRACRLPPADNSKRMIVLWLFTHEGDRTVRRSEQSRTTLRYVGFTSIGPFFSC